MVFFEKNGNITALKIQSIQILKSLNPWVSRSCTQKFKGFIRDQPFHCNRRTVSTTFVYSIFPVQSGKKKKKKDLSYVFKNRSCILLSPEKLNSFYVFWVAAVFNSWRHFRTEQIELNAEKKTHIQKLLHFFILTIFEKYKWQTLLCAQYLDTWSVLMLLILFRGIGYGRR